MGQNNNVVVVYVHVVWAQCKINVLLTIACLCLLVTWFFCSYNIGIMLHRG